MVHQCVLPVSCFSNSWMPIIDAFASPDNAKCQMFYSCGKPYQGSMVDTFTHRCISHFLYVFPLIPLILRVLQKIIADQTSCLLVTPWWPRQLWFVTLLHLSLRNYIQLSEALDLLSQQNEKAIMTRPSFI